MNLTNPNPGAPLIVSCGLGVDSVAVLVAFKAAGIRPDLLLFADTGGEKPSTYAYRDNVLNPWLATWGCPAVQTVKYQPLESTPYTTLQGNCTVNETLPSVAFGLHSCSVKWKIAPQDNFIHGVSKGPNKRAGWQPALDAWARGAVPVKVIGYDSSPADRKRAGKVHGKVYDTSRPYTFWYPLQDLGWERRDCIAAILAEGLPVPEKSACYFCPSSKVWELWWLAGAHPELFVDACRMEYGALTGRHSRWDSINWGAWDSHLGTGKEFPSKSHCGLGRSFSWCKWGYDNGVIDLDRWEVIAPPARCLAEATRLRGYDNAADVRGCATLELADEPVEARPLVWEQPKPQAADPWAITWQQPVQLEI
jgi:hypothetical protein